MEEWICSSIILDPVALSPGKEPWCPLDRRLGWLPEPIQTPYVNEVTSNNEWWNWKGFEREWFKNVSPRICIERQNESIATSNHNIRFRCRDYHANRSECGVGVPVIHTDLSVCKLWSIFGISAYKTHLMGWIPCCCNRPAFSSP